MIINSITLKNFKSYEDETTFSFNPNDKKNIVLIGGENGAGKSTLFEAIKLCIYGPITYGYLGQNHNYLTKIKNNINDNAFKNKTVDCVIALDVSFKDGTDIKNYCLKRTWTYDNQKLYENFDVYLFNKKLNEDDKLYFNNYLKSIIPPSLFDFFFFDGEELSDFFTGKGANTNLKEAILQLFNYDTFDILKKQLLSYQRIQSKSNEQLKNAHEKYDELSKTIKNLKTDVNLLQSDINNISEKLENLLVKKIHIEEDFKNSGGLLESEKLALNHEITKLENERLNINQYIKDFCNNTLPFVLVSDILRKIQTQIDKEDALSSYNSIKTKLSGKIIEKSLTEHNLNTMNKSVYNELAITLLSNMFNINELNEVSNILQLSSEQKNSINFVIDNLLSKSNTFSKEINTKFVEISSISSKLKKLKEKLRSTVSSDILNNYINSLNQINTKINEYETIIAIKKSKLESKYEDIKNKEYHLVRAKNEYTSLLKNSNVADLSNDIVQYLNELLKNLTREKLSLIEKEFIYIFSKIIRKNNYVNSIVIDDNFNSTLYINKDYNTTDILNIINNLGFDGLSKKYGSKFLDDLFTHYNVTNTTNLKESLLNDILTVINLSTKVNIHDFSNGEKQVYILCLIWSIIKSSDIEIPFIIDTPYARIDESHRNSLTTTYLPNISKQVIILSTNKEIDKDLYEVVRPYICNEYLLMYNTTLRKTEIKTGYFEV